MWERTIERVNERLGNPVWWNDLLQLVKTVLAGVVAWVLAAEVLDLPQPFLAPWAALLVVHATVYRTMSHGMQQVAATVVAVVLATAVGEVLGLTTAAVTLVLALALLMAAVPWLGVEATTIATTGLVVLTTGFEDDVMLVSRLLDTAIGVAVGLLVNVLVWPPLRRHTAAEALDRIDDAIGELLGTMAEGLAEGASDDDVDAWIARTRDLDGDLDHAWALVRQAQESARMNPRRSARPMRDPKEWRELCVRMEQAVAETRSLARTLGGRQTERLDWSGGFTRRWVELLGAAGQAAVGADPDGLMAVRRRLAELSEDLRATDRSPEWAVYGALIINLRNIVDAMDEVAGAHPIKGRALRLAIPTGRGPQEPGR